MDTRHAVKSVLSDLRVLDLLLGDAADFKVQHLVLVQRLRQNDVVVRLVLDVLRQLAVSGIDHDQTLVSGCAGSDAAQVGIQINDLRLNCHQRRQRIRVIWNRVDTKHGVRATSRPKVRDGLANEAIELARSGSTLHKGVDRPVHHARTDDFIDLFSDRFVRLWNPNLVDGKFLAIFDVSASVITNLIHVCPRRDGKDGI